MGCRFLGLIFCDSACTKTVLRSETFSPLALGTTTRNSNSGFSLKFYWLKVLRIVVEFSSIPYTTIKVDLFFWTLRFSVSFARRSSKVWEFRLGSTKRIDSPVIDVSLQELLFEWAILGETTLWGTTVTFLEFIWEYWKSESSRLITLLWLCFTGFFLETASILRTYQGFKALTPILFSRSSFILEQSCGLFSPRLFYEPL